jgi:hypothetical protein
LAKRPAATAMPLDRNVVLSTDGIFLHGVFLSAVYLTM